MAKVIVTNQGVKVTEYPIKFSVVETLSKEGYYNIQVIKKGYGTCNKKDMFGEKIYLKFTY